MLAPGLYLLGSLATGALGGLVWRTTTVLPGYTVQPDGKAVLSEYALTRVFEATAAYCLVGILGGLLLGLLAVLVLRRQGRWIVAWAVAGPLLAGLAAWAAGVLGGTPVSDRIAAASPGDVVPIDLALGTPVAVLVWPFLAMLPVLLWSAFSPDPDGTARRSGLRTDRRDDGGAELDQVGRGDLELE
ncbi:hypothetical protein GA0111570_10530 [Raineyella antarctica]|uniref:DUF2567 domain-containing protein n=2 Tax=Raineyella antarctica TaxID=1577474 RepID=A0A1G6GVS0_9ACTN|nr:hypothetical protein GA0111570_10530 [Raineyella antarctica]